MSKQSNKVQKRQRRKAYLKRRSAATKAKAATAPPVPKAEPAAA